MPQGGGLSPSVPVTNPREGTGTCTPKFEGDVLKCLPPVLDPTLHCQHHLAQGTWGAMQPIINSCGW